MQTFSIGFFLLTLIVWLFRASKALKTYLRAPRVLPRDPSPAGRISVTVIVPAKNEEKNIRRCLEGLLAQDYPHCEIIVINDNSTDRTEAILKEMGAVQIAEGAGKENPGAARLRYLNCPLPPAEWTGKNHALHHGAPHANGDWLLFTDADTRHAPESVSASLAFALENRIELLTLLPRCIAESAAERTIQPAAMAFTGLWFPIDEVNDPGKKVYFGNGQYILITRALYGKIGGHESVKGEFLEDFALFKAAKDSGARAACALAGDIFGTRMYDSLAGMWKGWRRIYLHAFGKRPGILAAKAASVFTFSVLPFFLLGALALSAAWGGEVHPVLWSAGLASAAAILVTSWKGYGVIKAKRVYCLLHPAACFFVLLVLLDALKMALTGKKTTWR